MPNYSHSWGRACEYRMCRNIDRTAPIEYRCPALSNKVLANSLISCVWMRANRHTQTDRARRSAPRFIISLRKEFRANFMGLPSAYVRFSSIVFAEPHVRSRYSGKNLSMARCYDRRLSFIS